jgi:hypothetical protein
MRTRNLAGVAREHSKRRQRNLAPVRRRLPKRQGSSQGRNLRQRFNKAHRRGDDVSPLEPPPAVGLTLPRLESVPEWYWLETQLQETAHLAHTLVRCGVLPARAYQQGQNLLTFFHSAFEERLKELGLGASKLDITLKIADETPNDVEGVYFTVNLQPVYLDLGPLVKKLDMLDVALAPALVAHVSIAAERIVPAFEGHCCYETVEWLIWGGDEGELLLQARDELARARHIDPKTLSQEEVSTFADSHYLTSNHLDERLEPRFQQPCGLSLGDLTAQFVVHRCDTLVQLCGVLERLEKLELPVSDSEEFYDRGDFNPYGLVLGLPKNDADDFVAEMFHELEQHVWSAGEWAPSYVFEINVQDDRALERLSTSIEQVLQGLTLMNEVVNLLLEVVRDDS